MLRRGNPLIFDAIEEGKVLYKGKDYERLPETFQAMRKSGMQRGSTSIILPETGET